MRRYGRHDEQWNRTGTEGATASGNRLFVEARLSTLRHVSTRHPPFDNPRQKPGTIWDRVIVEAIEMIVDRRTVAIAQGHMCPWHTFEHEAEMVARPMM